MSPSVCCAKSGRQQARRRRAARCRHPQANPVGCDYPIQSRFLALRLNKCQDLTLDGVITPYTIPGSPDPHGPFVDYDQPSTRGWFALALWQALDSYWDVRTV